MRRQIFAMGGGGCHMDDPAKNKLDNFIFGTVREAMRGDLREGPIKVVLLATAGGDDPREINFFLDYVSGPYCRHGCQVTVIRLFNRTLKQAELRKAFLNADLVYVFGGNTVSMLAVWRAHGVDEILLDAYVKRGVAMAGLSAGGICWFERGLLSDSLGPLVHEPVRGLGFLKGSFSPHHHNERTRVNAFRRMIMDGRLKPGYGVDDGTVLHFVDEKLEGVWTDGRSGSGAIRIGRKGEAQRLKLQKID